MSINQSNKSDHKYFMRLALMQAKIVLGNTKKNPAVGCVLVKNNSLVGIGHTGIDGRPHAEHSAIFKYKKMAKNSDLYVTLEPCSHYGKTAPCVKKIIKNKIKKVFISIKDPDIRSFNKSENILKKHKIPCKNNILNIDTKKFYKSYFRYKKKLLPYVTAKIAISKDYLTVDKKNKWITNKYSRGRVHLMRSSHDCILTSAKTVISDNPRLTCRINGLEYKSPARAVIDKNLEIPLNSYLVKSSNVYPTYVFFNKGTEYKKSMLKKSNVKLIKIDLNLNCNFDLKKVLNKIRKIGFSRIFLEAGLNLTTNFLKEGLISDFKLFISKRKLNKNGKNNFKKNMKLLLKKNNYHIEKTNLLGDKLISYRTQ